MSAKLWCMRVGPSEGPDTLLDITLKKEFTHYESPSMRTSSYILIFALCKKPPADNAFRPKKIKICVTLFSISLNFNSMRVQKQLSEMDRNSFHQQRKSHPIPIPQHLHWHEWYTRPVYDAPQWCQTLVHHPRPSLTTPISSTLCPFTVSSSISTLRMVSLLRHQHLHTHKKGKPGVKSHRKFQTQSRYNAQEQARVQYPSRRLAPCSLLLAPHEKYHTARSKP